MAKIKFTDHALLKIEILKSHGVEVSKEIVEDVIKFPDKIEKGYKNRLVAQKKTGEKHVLRVVHEKVELTRSREDEKFLVITLYPGRRSRYEKD